MNAKNWQITITHPDYCPKSNAFAVSTAQLGEITRNSEFSDMIDNSVVLGGLIAASEAIQDRVCSQ